ncbi:DDHD-domain-containing protein [Aspergillus indologenus CBS 114.80]|uniref:DDHD-domain-containing protein n=1 Tax=Aspergillus indologenus CBS 114.80 TaxID=1450541 RepID=A0A2V5IF06_9EURO|nr:DDHD-domain-containing protein [Aspergillus indologenus CBS 114.80]
MPKESQRGPFLGAISPWSSPQSSTPLSTTDKQHDVQNILKQSQGQDHAITHRYRLSLHRYPQDCPPLSVKWFYAVDSPKRKPELSTSARNKEDLKLPPPKKFVQFSTRDSHAIEEAFQRISDIEVENENFSHGQADPGRSRVPTKVSVNEDFLFDVNVECRELAPTYWVGPIYEVRRGTWFFQEGSTMKPCEENLATQLEEGYLKLKPWRCLDTRRSPSAASSTTPGHQGINEPRHYRLFGAYMSNIVTYQDASTALLTSDDFMSRVSTTVYQKLGAVAGTKLVRGFNEAKKPTNSSKCGTPQKQAHEGLKRRTKLPGQLEVDSKLLEEQVRAQEQKEMEASKDSDEDRDREIDHLVLVTHGIGQRLGLRLESVNFIHDVNVLRKTMKSVYRASPDLQALNSQFADKHENCRIQVLPVCWRHMLDFPYQRMEQSRKELDLADAEAPEDAIPAYPTLSDITLDNVPAVRNLISDLAMDVLLYQSAYCEQISHIVKGECNRILRLFKERNPSFKGSVSLCGHSLGSAILFDILCHEPHDSHQASPSVNARQPEFRGNSSLEFQCQEFFCLGSPVALFQMLKGKTIAGRQARDEGVAEVSSFPEKCPLETPLQHTSKTRSFPSHQTSTVRAQTESSVSSPKCGQLYNIFHPSDPVSYRLEPLISPALSSLKPQPLPSVKKSLWATSGQSLSMIGSRVGQSVGSLWTNFTSGVASSLLNRSLGLSPEDASTRSSENAAGAPEADSGSKRILLEDAKVRALNANGRVDYSIQEGAFDISMIASIASHLSYWTDEDVSHFMLSQMLCRRERSSGTQNRP